MLNVAAAYRERPSKVLGIEDDYAAFCFDEACQYIEGRLMAGDKPVYAREVKSMKDFYKELI